MGGIGITTGTVGVLLPEISGSRIITTSEIAHPLPVLLLSVSEVAISYNSTGHHGVHYSYYFPYPAAHMTVRSKVVCGVLRLLGFDAAGTPRVGLIVTAVNAMW